MANTLTLTTMIPIPNLRTIKLGKVNMDEDNAVATVEVLIIAAGGVAYSPFPWIIQIGNGSADAIVANASALTVGDVMVMVSMGGPGLTTAFNQLLAAYQATKRDGLLNALKGLTGTVLSSPRAAPLALIGTSQTVLPPGTVG